MKNVLKSIGIYLFIMTILLIAPSSKAFAAVQCETLSARQNVACDKVWSIKVNMDVNPAIVNSNNVKVVNSSGVSVSLKLGYLSGSQCITAAPINEYEPGKTYTLIIENLQSKGGLALSSPIEMQFTTAAGAEAPESAAFNLVDTHTYEITDIISVSGPSGAGYNLTFDIGAPSSSPYQKDTDIKVSGTGAKMISTPSGTEQLTAQGAVPSSGSTEYKVVRTVQNSGIKYTSDISNTSGDYSGFKDYIKYTSPEEKIQSDDASIKAEAQKLFSGITNPYLKAKKAFEFVNDYMTYDEADGNKGALSALQTGKGVCEDYAELFTALLRASGVPSRIATGFWVEDQGFAGGTADGDNYRHAWPEFYLPEYGWIIVEPTFEYIVNGIREIDYSHFANLDSSDHFIEGYNVDGAYVDTGLSWGSKGDVNMEEHSYIKRLN